MFELPDYEIIAWIVGHELGKKLEKDILSSIDIMPYESVDYEGCPFKFKLFRNERRKS